MAVIDDLVTFSAADSLSAKQGFILNNRLVTVEGDSTNLKSRVTTLENQTPSGSGSTTLKIWS